MSGARHRRPRRSTRAPKERSILRLTFLGTASSRPTVARNVSSIAVQREGRLFLFDCGEGTQRQMMRFGVGFSVTDIFVSHLHADHYLGLTGLLRTLGLQGRTEPLSLWGPPGSLETLRLLRDLGGETLPFATPILAMSPGTVLREEGYRIEAFSTRHTRESMGLALIEDDRPGRFDVERARALGVPEGPSFGALHRGESVRLEDGRIVEPADLVGPPRRGRRLVYSADTRPCPATIEIARRADILVHEATFDEAEAPRARETGHSTAAEAADVARRAEARRLVLTHLSARYSDRADRLLEEARAIFPATRIARDGLVVEIPLPPDDETPVATGAADGR